MKENWSIRLLALWCLLLPGRLSSQCDFTISNYTPCAEETLTLEVVAPSGDYSWDFNEDGLIDDVGPSVNYFYSNTGTVINTQTITLYRDGTACPTDSVSVLPAPDASLGVVPGSGILDGNEIRICSGSSNATLSIYNASATIATNLTYEIDWGDGSPVETFNNVSFSATNFVDHTYSGLGYFSLDLTTTGVNGCTASESYVIYIGSNPSVGLVAPGTTVGACAPQTITFPITGTNGNPSGTQYLIFISDSLVASYTQADIPSDFTFVFTESSCGVNTSTGQYDNAFDVRIVASNPCGSTQSTIEPIEVSTPPNAEFVVSPPVEDCVGDPYTFTNNSTGINEIRSGNPATCETTLLPSWVLSPGIAGVDWNIISGNLFSSDIISIEFLRPGDYTISMTVTSDACGPDTYQTIITIVDPPVADATLDIQSNSSSGVDECVSTQVELTNQSTGDGITTSWSINPSAGYIFLNGTDVNSQDVQIEFTDPGSYTLSLAATNVCATDVWDTTIVLAGLPQVVIDPISDFCETAVLNFDLTNLHYSANGGSFNNFDWSFPGAVPSSSADQYPGNVVYSTPGNYTIELTATNQCGSFTTSTTFNIQTPGTVVLEPDRQFCQNDPDYSLSPNPPGGSWSGNGVSTIGIFTPANASIGSNTLIYTVQDSSCILIDSMIIDVLALPVVDAGTDTSLCVDGDPFLLAGATPGGGTWSVNNGGIITGSNFFDPAASGPNVYTLSYSYTDTDNCSNTDARTITVYNLPVVEAGPDQDICENPYDIPLTGFSPKGGSWSGPGVTADGVFNAGNTSGIGSYSLYYSYTHPSTQCVNTDSLIVNVVANPVAEAGTNDTVCLNEAPFVLSTGSPSGGSWSGAGINGGQIFNPQDAGTGTHILTYTYGSGYCQTTDTKLIMVRELPALTILPDQSLCIDAPSLDLSSSSPSGGQWSGPGVSGVAFDPGAAGAGIHTLSYSYTDTSSQCSNVATVNIEVFDLPTLSANDTTLCNTPGAVDLPYASPGGGHWSGPGISSDQFDPAVAGGAGSYLLSYSYTDANTCNNTISITIEVIDPQNIDAGPDRQFCVSDAIYDLSALATPPGGQWSANNGSGLTGDQFDPAQAGPGTYLLRYSVGSGNCQVTDDLTLEVQALPVVDAGQDLAVCYDSEAFDLTGFSPSGGSWSGIPVADSLTGTVNPKGLDPGVYTLRYEYADNNGCSNRDSIALTVHPLPAVNAGNDTSYCLADLLETLPAAIPSGGSWTGPGIVDPSGSFNPLHTGAAGSYILVYHFTESATGCSFQDSIRVEVLEPQPIDAGPAMALCKDQGLTTLQPMFPSNGIWTGPGIVDSINGVINPDVLAAGDYTLIYYLGSGSCRVEDQKEIRIVDLSYVSAGVDEQICVNAEPIFLDDQQPTGGRWSGPGILDGLNGSFDPAQAGPGIHIMTYRYTDEDSGCVGSDTKQVEVFPFDPPEFSLPSTACVGSPIDFNNESNTLYTAFWDFGDGNISNQFNPRHSFASPNTYSVHLIVENENGCRDSVRHNIFVTERPVPDFKLDTTEACVGIEIGVDNQSYGYQISYTWNFGNGQFSTEENPSFQYFEQGVNDTLYVVTLGVTNGCGTRYHQDTVRIHPNPVIEFGVSPESDCSPVIYSFANSSYGSPDEYYWNFGNGFSSTEKDPEPQAYYTDSLISYYDIILIGSNECGSDTATTTVEIAPATVQAFFNTSTLLGCQPLEVEFFNYSTPGARIDWHFGDGNTSVEENPLHLYTQPGEYQVIQYATSECGYDSTTLVITVLPAPEVAFEHPTYVCQDEVIDFTNLSNNVSGTQWDFDDGDSSNLYSPSHVFRQAGRYQVQLTGISTFNQCPASYTSEVIVRGLPTAAFEPNASNGCMPLEVRFQNESEAAFYYQWDFGDGNNSVNESPVHTFEDAGNYEVKLLATDDHGCFNDSTVLNIIVHPIPTADFVIEREKLCGVPVQMYFENRSVGASGHEWNFGDGQSSQRNEPLHEFSQAGDYSISLIAQNQFACTDEHQQLVTVYENPEANFELDQMAGCSPLDVRFANRSNYANRFYWNFGSGWSSEAENPDQRYSTPGSYEVQLIVSQDDICFDTLVRPGLITVHPSPLANFIPVEIDSDPHSGTYQMSNQSIDADQYYWDFGDGSHSTEAEPTHRYFTNGSRQIYLEATNEHGCIDDTLITFSPDFFKGLFLPNGLSPEQGIGEVTVFLPKGVGLEEYHLQIYSPYGQLLWETTQLQEGQPAEAWNGTHRGKLLPQDVYVWKCFARFADGTVWAGQKDEQGNYKTMGSVILLR